MQKSKELLNKLEKMTINEGVINDILIKRLNSLFSEKSEKVMEVIKRGIVKLIGKSSNRIFWIAIGDKKEHLIYPKLYCSCQDFYKNVVIKKKNLFCKHILAQVISEALDDYKTKYCTDKDFEVLLQGIDSEI